MAYYASPPTYQYATVPPLGTYVYYKTPPRGHRHGFSADFTYSNSKPAYESPRYDRYGDYATRTPGRPPPPAGYEYVSESSRPPQARAFSYESRPHPRPSTRERRHTDSYRLFPTHGDSDEDEIVVDAHGRPLHIPGFTRFEQELRFAREEALRARERASRRAEEAARHASRAHRTDARHYDEDIKYDKHGRAYVYEPRPREPSPSPMPRKESASTPKKPSTTRRPSTAQRKAASPPKARPVTQADIDGARIPKGYSVKNWDPDEEALFLLGSVFDCNSLGKWIYDWTVYRYQAGTPIADMAGELWLLLIALSGKVKRAEEVMPRIRTRANKEMVDDFIESGERLMDKMQKLLKLCEKPMLKAEKRRSARDPVRLGNDAGVKFVEHIFGRDDQLSYTERLMAGIRLWSMRFDANCDDILRRPSQ